MAQEREESQGFFEMLWDCDHCDTRGLLAKSQRYCANCGAPQNPDKRYFPKEGEAVRVDGHQFVGADRVCPACSAPQSAAAHNCTHCGSPLDGGAEVRGVMAQPAAPPPRPKRAKRKIWPWLVGALVIVGFAIWFKCVRTQSAQVVVSGHSWKRSIAVEEFGDQTQNAWRNEVPRDASPPMCIEKSRSTRQVPDGEDCHTERRDKKDGTFEQVKKCVPKTRSEPVMDSWCTFTVRRWHVVSSLDAHGTGLSPTWPEGVPQRQVTALFGAKREGNRTESLILEFKDHGTCEVSEAVWRKYADGQKLKAEIHSGGDVACGSL